MSRRIRYFVAGQKKTFFVTENVRQAALRQFTGLRHSATDVIEAPHSPDDEWLPDYEDEPVCQRTNRAKQEQKAINWLNLLEPLAQVLSGRRVTICEDEECFKRDVLVWLVKLDGLSSMPIGRTWLTSKDYEPRTIRCCACVKLTERLLAEGFFPSGILITRHYHRR